MNPPQDGGQPIHASIDKPGSDLARRRAAFSTRHETYLGQGLDRLAAARLVAAFVGRRSGRALDVGTGKGLLAIELARLGLDVVSVDIDSDERELAALLAREAGVATWIELVTADARRLPYDSGFFGCAAMMDVLHHLESPVAVLSEMVRVVRPGGSLVVADFSGTGFEIVSRVHRADGLVHHESGATVGAARTFIESQGLRVTADVEAHCHHILAAVKPWAQDVKEGGEDGEKERR